MIKTLLTLLVLVPLTLSLVAQVTPTYLGSIDPHESSSIPYADRGRIIINLDSIMILGNGFVDVLDNWQRNGQLIKYNMNKNIVHSVITMTGPQEDLYLAAGILHTDDHLYLIGSWIDYINERTRPFLAKYTTSLEEVWTNYMTDFSDLGLDYYFYDICSAFDDDIVLVYYTQVQPGPVNIFEAYALKVDTAGVVQFNKHLLDTVWWSMGRGNIVPTDDGHYLVSSYCAERYLPEYPEHFVLHKIDEEGEIVWTQYRVGWQKKFQVPRIADLPGGGAVMGVVRDTLAIFDNLPASTQFYYALEAFTPEGESAWRYSWFYKVNATIESLRRAANGDIIGCGFWYEFDPPYRGWVFRFSPEGELKWSRQYNDAPNRPWDLGQAPLYFNRLTELPDQRIAITGFAIDSTDYPGANGMNANVLLMILDSMGCLVPGCIGEDQIISSTEGWQVIGRVPMLGLDISPNPATNYIRLSWPGDKPPGGFNSQLHAYDMKGRIIWSDNWLGEARMIDIISWPQGQVTLICLTGGQPVALSNIVIVKP